MWITPGNISLVKATIVEEVKHKHYKRNKADFNFVSLIKLFNEQSVFV